MSVAAATAVVLGPAAITNATAVADNGRCLTMAVAAMNLAAARTFSATATGCVLLSSSLQVSGAVTRLAVYRAASHQVIHRHAYWRRRPPRNLEEFLNEESLLAENL